MKIEGDGYMYLETPKEGVLFLGLSEIEFLFETGEGNEWTELDFFGAFFTSNPDLENIEESDTKYRVSKRVVKNLIENGPMVRIGNQEYSLTALILSDGNMQEYERVIGWLDYEEIE